MMGKKVRAFRNKTNRYQKAAQRRKSLNEKRGAKNIFIKQYVKFNYFLFSKRENKIDWVIAIGWLRKLIYLLCIVSILLLFWLLWMIVSVNFDWGGFNNRGLLINSIVYASYILWAFSLICLSFITSVALWKNSNKITNVLVPVGFLGLLVGFFYFKPSFKFQPKFQPKFEYKPTVELNYPDYECVIPIKELEKIEYQVSGEFIKNTADKMARTVLISLDEKTFSKDDSSSNEDSHNLKMEIAGKLDTSSLKELKIICSSKPK